MHIDHVCVAVRSIEKSAPKLCQLLGFAVKTGKVSNTRQQVNVQFLHRPGSIDIKLIGMDPNQNALSLYRTITERFSKVLSLNLIRQKIPHIVI